MNWEIEYLHRMETEKLHRNAERNRPHRRLKLQAFAQKQFKRVNQGQALVNIIAKAADLVKDLGDSSICATSMIDDLVAVLIGEGMTNEGRGRGTHFAGQVTGALGFKGHLRDPWNQIQHAMAGVAVGYRYGKLGEWFARWVEEEEQDDALYVAACPLGRWLSWNRKDFDKLAEKVRKAICDGTVRPPSIV